MARSGCSLPPMRSRRRSALWVAAATLGAVVACCDDPDASFYTCANPDKGHVGPDGLPDPCHWYDPVADAGLDGPCVKDLDCISDLVCVDRACAVPPCTAAWGC